MEFLNQARLEEIIKRHSEFITFPIYLNKKTEEVVEASSAAEASDEAKVDEDIEITESDESSAEEEKKTEKVRKHNPTNAHLISLLG